MSPRAALSSNHAEDMAVTTPSPRDALQALLHKAVERDESVRAQIAAMDQRDAERKARFSTTETFARALEERDRQLADLQREADARLADLDSTTQTMNAIHAEAIERERLIGDQVRVITELDAALQATREHEAVLESELAAARSELESLRAQCAILSEAAQERLVALELNAAAVADLRLQLSEYQREAEALRERLRAISQS